MDCLAIMYIYHSFLKNLWHLDLLWALQVSVIGLRSNTSAFSISSPLQFHLSCSIVNETSTSSSDISILRFAFVSIVIRFTYSTRACKTIERLSFLYYDSFTSSSSSRSSSRFPPLFVFLPLSFPLSFSTFPVFSSTPIERAMYRALKRCLWAS